MLSNENQQDRYPGQGEGNYSAYGRLPAGWVTHKRTSNEDKQKTRHSIETAPGYLNLLVDQLSCLSPVPPGLRHSSRVGAVFGCCIYYTTMRLYCNRAAPGYGDTLLLLIVLV